MSSGRFRTWLNLPGLNVSLDLNGRPFYLPRSLAYFYRLVNMIINNNPMGKLRSVPGAEGEVPPPRIVPRQPFQSAILRGNTHSSSKAANRAWERPNAERVERKRRKRGPRLQGKRLRLARICDFTGGGGRLPRAARS